MNKTILIPYLHQFGEEVILGNKENKKIYDKEFIDEMFNKLETREKIRKNSFYIELYSYYNKIELNHYMERIFNGLILNEILTGKDYVNEARIAANLLYHNDHGIIIHIKDEYLRSKDLLDILERNKVFATFLWDYDTESKEIIKINKICLCLGSINNHILFI